MPNRYPGICYRCGGTVPAGDGVFEKVGRAQAKKWGEYRIKSRWQVQHHNCAAEWRGTTQHYLFDDLRPKAIQEADGCPAPARPKP